jgi:hypothetical protein
MLGTSGNQVYGKQVSFTHHDTVVVPDHIASMHSLCSCLCKLGLCSCYRDLMTSEWDVAANYLKNKMVNRIGMKVVWVSVVHVILCRRN